MRRGPKPAKSKEAKPPVGRKSPKDDARVRDLEKRLAEAEEQQAATAQILHSISSSPTELQTVLDAVAKSAARLCASYDASILRLDGEVLRLVAHHGPVPVPPTFVMPVVRGLVGGRAVLERRPIQVADLQMQTEEFSEGSAIAREHGFHTLLSVPLIREGAAIGIIALRRIEVQPFTDSQIALLETFADQAVIAIQNVRLFKELQARNRDLVEALEQKTATSEILRVISQSPTDVQPVFGTIVRNAVQLCGAKLGAFFRFDGEQLHPVANHGHSLESLAVFRRVYPMRPDRSQAAGRAILDRAVTEIPDAREDPAYDREMALTMDWRSVLAVPLLRGDGRPVGVIVIQSQEAGHFAPGHVGILQTFADQAVIAIENVRLFNETKEALDRQTATAEILRVISSSPTDIQPVFDAIARSAVRLCDGLLGTVLRVEGDRLNLGALYNLTREGEQAYRENYPMPIGRETVAGNAILDRRVINVIDAQDPTTVPPRSVAIARAAGFRGVIAVPLLRDGEPIGLINVARRNRGAFSEGHIRLIQTFADQAVIAIENVRLFTELQTSNRDLTTALDKQTATSDILRAISRSQTDVQPVFDAIVESAVRLLRGFVAAMSRLAGDQLELVAFTSTDAAGDAAVRSAFPQALHSDWPHPRVVRERSLLNVTDARSDPRLPAAIRNLSVVRGYHSLVVVPMLRHHEAVGAISLTRREPGGFTDDEIALLQTFADQAVIAIENARLLTELQERTQELTRSVEQLTALGEVGRAVSSTLNLETVLTTIVSRAVQLSGLDGGVVFEYDESAEE